MTGPQGSQLSEEDITAGKQSSDWYVCIPSSIQESATAASIDLLEADLNHSVLLERERNMALMKLSHLRLAMS